MRISNGVVRAASPGAKEWAEATAREVEFIEGDWAALGWALGSMRLLLRCKDAPITSAADVPQAALDFARKIRRRTVLGCAVCAFVVFSFSRLALRMHQPAQRIGACLVVASVLYMTLQLLARRGRLSLRWGTLASMEAYRNELERQRDFHRGIWLWSRVVAMVPGYLLFCIAGAIVHPVIARQMAGIVLVYLILGVLAVPLNLRRARGYQRRIDELDALESEA